MDRFFLLKLLPSPLKNWLLCVVTGTLLTIGGCTIPLACEIYNNSQQDLELIYIQSDGRKFKKEFPAHSSILLEGWSLGQLKIISKDSVWVYRAVDISQKYIGVKGFGFWKKRLFYAQLEKDGRIFILQTNQAFPIQESLTQPEGFPLIPQIISNNSTL